MKSLLFIVAGTAMLVIACNGKSSKKDNPIESPGDLKDYADKVNQETKASTGKWEERKAKGDTLAMPYADLQAFLPDISGYDKDGGPKGSQMNMPGMGSWSQAVQEYKNGDKQIKVEIMDYNAAFQAFTAATAIFKMGYSMEDDSKKQGSLDLGIKDVSAYQTIYKTDPRAELTLIAGDRFFIQVESRGSNDPQLLSSVAKSIKLSELASR
ncbi:MAG TPA: hypothetical protein VLD19_14660 [Chitinophagaceae bacterium]|nr:hypothetical protein [Chitinophagaceae bacterium]